MIIILFVSKCVYVCVGIFVSVLAIVFCVHLELMFCCQVHCTGHTQSIVYCLSTIVYRLLSMVISMLAVTLNSWLSRMRMYVVVSSPFRGLLISRMRSSSVRSLGDFCSASLIFSNSSSSVGRWQESKIIN